MSNLKRLSRNQWITIVGIAVTTVLTILGWFVASPSKPKQSQLAVIEGGSGSPNTVINGNNNTVVQSPRIDPSGPRAADAAPRKKAQAAIGKNANQEPTQIQIANAPNGIAITGGNVNNPTVNNYGAPVAPPAVIHICASKSTPDNKGAVYQVFTLTTDSKVEAPRYNFWFNGVLPESTSASSPDMAMNIREGQSDSRFAFQLFQTWYPGQRINVEVRSATPMALVNESGEHQESFVLSTGDCGSGL